MVDLQNCAGCGKDFLATGRERKCGLCRAPQRRDSREKRTRSRGKRLSLRERQIIGLIARGKPNKEIGGVLRLTEGTVKEYNSRIFLKLDVSSRMEVALWAWRRPEEFPDIERTPLDSAA